MHLEIAIARTNKFSGCKMCIIICTPSLLKTQSGEQMSLAKFKKYNYQIQKHLSQNSRFYIQNTMM